MKKYITNVTETSPDDSYEGNSDKENSKKEISDKQNFDGKY